MFISTVSDAIMYGYGWQEIGDVARIEQQWREENT